MKDDLKNLHETEAFINAFKANEEENYFKTLAANYVEKKGALLMQEATELENSVEPSEFDINRLDAKMYISLEREKFSHLRRKRFAAWGTIAASFVVALVIGAYWFASVGNHTNPSISSNDAVTGSQTKVAGARTEESVVADSSALNREPAEEAEEAVNTDDNEMSYEPPSAGISPPAISPPVSSGRVFSAPYVPQGWQIVHTVFENEIATLHMESATGYRVMVFATETPLGRFSPMPGAEKIFVNGSPVFLLASDEYSVLFFELGNFQVMLSTPNYYTELLELAEDWL